MVVFSATCFKGVTILEIPMSYYVQNKTTGQPTHYTHKGRVEKSYSIRILAEMDAEKIEQANYLKASRIDVVEISKSARLYLENQIWLNQMLPL